MFFKPGLLENRLYLVVDDFGDMRSMMKNMLMACGVREITLARNGAEAIEQMEEKRFDVVLCDYNLGPGRDGQQVLEEAKHRQLFGLGCVFVMVTAENTREMVMGAVEYEPDSYLTKPFNKDLLKTRLEKLIARRENLLPVEKAMEKRDLSLALRILDEKIDTKPSNINELRKIKGEVLLNSGKIRQAQEVYEEVLAIRDLAWARLGLGKCLYQAQKYDISLTQFQQLISQNPNFTPAYDWLAKCHKSLKQYSEAQEVLKSAVKISPKAVLRQQMLGEIALLNQDDQTAESAFSNAVKHGRHSVYKNPSNYANLAKVASKTQTGAAAGLDVIKQMKRDFKKDAKADLYRASTESLVHQAMGNDELAKASLEEAIAIHETLDQSNSTDCAIELAKTYSHFGMEDKSIELLKDTVLNDHTNQTLVDEVKLTMASLNMDEQTLGSVETIRKEVASLNSKGVELARNGQLEEAAELLKETSTRMPSNKTVNLNIALVLLMSMERHGSSSERIDDIKSYLARVARSDSDNPTLQKLYNRLKTSMTKAPN
ncbi:MAG: response regulator [Candidatus Thiodiazotropha sp. 6PLUC2]